MWDKNISNSSSIPQPAIDDSDIALEESGALVLSIDVEIVIKEIEGEHGVSEEKNKPKDQGKNELLGIMSNSFHNIPKCLKSSLILKKARNNDIKEQKRVSNLRDSNPKQRSKQIINEIEEGSSREDKENILPHKLKLSEEISESIFPVRRVSEEQIIRATKHKENASLGNGEFLEVDLLGERVDVPVDFYCLLVQLVLRLASLLTPSLL